MPATITKGHAFTLGGAFNAAALHALIESATLASVDRANIDTDTGSFISITTAAPSNPYTNEIWYDESNSDQIVRFNADEYWVPILPNALPVKAQGTVTRGQLVQMGTLAASGDFRIKTLDKDVTGSAKRYVGVCTKSATQGQWTGLIMWGYCPYLLVESPMYVGDGIALSGSTDGFAVRISNSGAIGVALSEYSSGGQGSVEAWLVK